MTNRHRASIGLASAVLAAFAAGAHAQDVPLYRDPSPTEGRRVEGPLLPARPSVPPPPSSDLGPFQPSAPDLAPSTAAPPPSEPLREPLLGISPMPPPLPALPVPIWQGGGDVAVRRSTKIQGPKGMLGHFHDWFRVAIFGPARPRAASNPPAAHHLFGLFHPHPDPAEGRSFSWPSWPLADRR